MQALICSEELDAQIIAACKQGPQLREDLMRITKAKRTTIYDHLVGLIARGLIRKQTAHLVCRGRPNTFFIYCGGDE